MKEGRGGSFFRKGSRLQSVLKGDSKGERTGEDDVRRKMSKNPSKISSTINARSPLLPQTLSYISSILSSLKSTN